MKAANCPSSSAEEAKKRVLESVFEDHQEAVVVNSPPGAGKTSLVLETIAVGVGHFKWRVAVVAPRIEQTYDIVRRLRLEYQDFPIQLLHSKEHDLPSDMVAAGVQSFTGAAGLAKESCLVVANVTKMFFSLQDFEGRLDLLICDEAYQVPAKDLMPLYEIADRILLVGDPGQLRPIVKSDVARFEAAECKVHWPAPLELINRHPNIVQVSLPATWRLVQDTVDFVQPSFYPNLPYMSGVKSDDRRLVFEAEGMGDPIDRVLDMIAEGKSLVALMLPALTHEPGVVDTDVADVCARVAARVLDRSPSCNGHTIRAQDLGYVDAHVASCSAVEKRLRNLNIGNELQAITPEKWQGRERPIMIAKHTLSGRRRFNEFELEPGRLCVMTSRHKLACIIVSRDGLGEAVENHQHNCADWPSGAESLEWRGWNANREFWRRMESMGRIIRT